MNDADIQRLLDEEGWPMEEHIRHNKAFYMEKLGVETMTDKEWENFRKEEFERQQEAYRQELMNSPDYKPNQCNEVEEVVEAFEDFLAKYDDFRANAGFSSKLPDIYEITTAMSDKHGRICRQIKHAERNDHKPDWPLGLTESLIGYIVYSTMILKKYDIDIAEGLRNELNEAVKQHG
jgi:hypothetical protein